ncbi:Oidioi.mRNA.OKI2018_I69.chr2.g6146.t1.cds [Oikopleura dioica]|uniref:Oidioi.mRNA.OKI2018_I69.chr2.g6146.t1.cds n=1 Tax=Oikopleura dioica TaxID=34765 RepID=A0ABN7T233_OIKDI|nr:Oidioi.mRNA.OKI2018_I69.chr2.g6146.t1.cds [Oikopleura dioica]
MSAERGEEDTAKSKSLDDQLTELESIPNRNAAAEKRFQLIAANLPAALLNKRIWDEKRQNCLNVSFAKCSAPMKILNACKAVKIDPAKLSDLYGRTLLHVAARVPDLAAADELLKLGADVN